jgi:hypothetical protein
MGRRSSCCVINSVLVALCCMSGPCAVLSAPAAAHICHCHRHCCPLLPSHCCHHRCSTSAAMGTSV